MWSLHPTLLDFFTFFFKTPRYSTRAHLCVLDVWVRPQRHTMVHFAAQVFCNTRWRDTAKQAMQVAAQSNVTSVVNLNLKDCTFPSDPLLIHHRTYPPHLLTLLTQSNAAKEDQAGGGGGFGAGYPQLRSLFTFMSELLGDPRRRQQLGPVLDQLGEFAREVKS